MEEFDLDELSGHQEMGIGDSRCAMVYREKIGVFMGLMEMMNTVDTGYDDDDEGTWMVYSEQERRPGSGVTQERLLVDTAAPGIPDDSPSGGKKKTADGTTRRATKKK
jgi:hypothetical protein